MFSFLCFLGFFVLCFFQSSRRLYTPWLTEICPPSPRKLNITLLPNSWRLIPCTVNKRYSREPRLCYRVYYFLVNKRQLVDCPLASCRRQDVAIDHEETGLQSGSTPILTLNGFLLYVNKVIDSLTGIYLLTLDPGWLVSLKICDENDNCYLF